MQPGPYSPPPSPVAAAGQIRPKARWFVVAGLLIAAGVVGAIGLWVGGALSFSDKIEGFARVDVPGTRTVVLDTGGYSVYQEDGGVFDDSFLSTPGVTITDPSGRPVQLSSYTSSVTYEASGHQGVALFSFRAERAGSYEVTTTGEGAGEIAIGRGIGRGIVSWILGGFAVGFVGVVGGIVLAIVTGVRRGRSRRMAYGPWGTSGPQGPPPGAGWGMGPGMGPPPGYPGGGPGGAPTPGTPGPATRPGAPPPGGGPGAPPPPGSPGGGPGGVSPPGATGSSGGGGALPPPGGGPGAMSPPGFPGRGWSTPPSGWSAPGWSPPGASASPPTAHLAPPGGRPGDPPSLRRPASWTQPDVPLAWSTGRGDMPVPPLAT